MPEAPNGSFYPVDMQTVHLKKSLMHLKYVYTEWCFWLSTHIFIILLVYFHNHLQYTMDI